MRNQASLKNLLPHKLKAKLCNYLNNNKPINKSNCSINLLKKRNKDKKKLNKICNLKRKLLKLKKKDKTNKSYQKKELKNLNCFKKKKLLKSLRLKRWNKNFCLPKQSKRQKLLLPRRLLLKQILLDWRESMSSQEERLKLNCKCWKLNNKWKLSKLWI